MSTQQSRTFVQFPTDVPRPPVLEYEAAARVARLAGASANSPVEPSVLLATLTALFQRYTQQEEIAFDLFFDDGAAEAGYVGVNLPVSPDLALGGLERILSSILDRVRSSSERRELASREGPPTANIAVTLIDADFENFGPAQWLERNEARHHYDLHFFASLRSAEGRVGLVYNARLFSTASSARLIDNFLIMLAGALADRSRPIRALPLLSTAELDLIRATWDSGRVEYPPLPVHRMFEQFAREQPQALAATFKDQTLTYAELDERSNRLAHYLMSMGCGGAGSRVAVCVTPSLDILVAIFAIFKCGAVYVPLDPTHPEALIAHVLDEVKPRIVLTQTHVSQMLLSLGNFQCFCFDRDAALLDAIEASPPDVTFGLDHPSHIFYTSGTTGKSKGVVAIHKNIAHFVQSARRRYEFGPTDRFCSLARYTFSISFFEVVLPLASGASVHLLERDTVLDPSRLARILSNVTALHAGPSLLGNLFKYFRENPKSLPTLTQLRHVSTGGDLVPAHLLEQAKEVFSNAEIFVIYGCTENTCMGTYFPVPRDHKLTKSYVGRPFPNVKVRVVDAADNFVPVGAVGEICFSGAGVVNGYLGRPALNAEKFTLLDGERYYHTGDMGRLDEAGDLEILGRRDFQIQLRGIRIELAGIENTVRELGLAAQCAVVAKRLGQDDDRLVAFVTHPRVASIAEFRKELGQRLPDYMLPQGLVVLEALPVTRNGKLDRNRLQELPWELPQVAPGTPPRNHAERVLADLFAAALRVPEIGVDQDFFDRGGHSLLAVSVLQGIEKHFGETLPLSAIIAYPTVERLAARLSPEAAAQETTRTSVVMLRAGGSQPIFFIHDGEGEIIPYRSLALHLDPKYAVYGVQPLSRRNQPMLHTRLDDMVHYYVEQIRLVQPQGPYVLGGLCIGGFLASEVARRLRGHGESVALLALFESAHVTAERKSETSQMFARFSKGVREDAGGGVVVKVLNVLRHLHRKVPNVVRHQLSSQLERTKATFKVRVLRTCLKFGIPVPSLAEGLRVSAILHFAEREYVVQPPYSGEVVLYRATHRDVHFDGTAIDDTPYVELFVDPFFGWRAHADNIEVHEVSGGHSSMFVAPHVDAFAKLFESHVQRALELCERTRGRKHLRSHSRAQAKQCGLLG